MRLFVLATSLSLLACAPQIIPLITTYDPAEAEFSRRPGQRIVSGQGFLRQAGGTVVTCAGAEVSLVASTSYSRERITALYGSTNGGLNPSTGGRRIPLDAAYTADAKTTRCDAQGNFVFRGVPPGDYFVSTLVTWINPVNASSPGGKAAGWHVPSWSGMPTGRASC